MVLIQLGYGSLKADGVMGPMTRWPSVVACHHGAKLTGSWPIISPLATGYSPLRM